MMVGGGQIKDVRVGVEVVFQINCCVLPVGRGDYFLKIISDGS